MNGHLFCFVFNHIQWVQAAFFILGGEKTPMRQSDRDCAPPQPSPPFKHAHTDACARLIAHRPRVAGARARARHAPAGEPLICMWNDPQPRLIKRPVNANRCRLLILHLRGQRAERARPAQLGAGDAGRWRRGSRAAVLMGDTHPPTHPHPNSTKGRCEHWPPLRIIWRQSAASKNKSITCALRCCWCMDLSPNAHCKYLCQSAPPPTPQKTADRPGLNRIDMRWPLLRLHPSKWVFKPRCRRLLAGSLAVKHFYNQTLLFAASLWEMRPCSFFKRANQP